MFTNAITLEGLDILEWRKRAENAEAEVERLKDAWESAELRADDGWREAERLRKGLTLAFEELDEERVEVQRLRDGLNDFIAIDEAITINHADPSVRSAARGRTLALWDLMKSCAGFYADGREEQK
jgi:hypothetical protein